METSTLSTNDRLYGFGTGKTNFRSGLFSRDNSRLNLQCGSSNNADDLPDQRQRISNIRTTNLGMRSYGLQSRNLTMQPNVLQDRNMLLNQEFTNKISNTSSITSKPFWPSVRNTTLTTGLQVQDTGRYNVVDEGEFRRPPAVTSTIRGRSTTFSGRLFQNQNTDQHYSHLSNINSFNVSHISRVDTLLESRLGLNMRNNNGVDNQSMSGSVLSSVTVKAQFMNVLENLHHSILKMGPHLNAESMRMEFDKAKQRLESISEMSFAPSVRPPPAASHISQSSRYICPTIVEPPTSNITNVIDGRSLNLRTSKDLLKTLISSKLNSTQTEENGKEIVTSSSRSKEPEIEGNSSFTFKKPQALNRKRKSMSGLKIKAPPAVKNSATKGQSKVINLKQWFPIAEGSDLMFSGVDESGKTVKTEAVKKRLSNRKVGLISGLDCNLIGSPSPMVSVLPRKIADVLRNGLTDKWRVFQRELSNCQTNYGETNKRKSKSPKVKTPPVKKIERLGEVKVNKRKAKSPKVISTPKNKGKGLHTRSGRTVKPPAMFWLANGNNEVTSVMYAEEVKTTVQQVKTTVKSGSSSEVTSVKSKVKSRGKKSRKVNEASPEKKSRKVTEASPERKTSKVIEATPEKKSKKVTEASPERKTSKVIEATPEKKSRKVTEASLERKTSKVIETTPKKKSKKVSEASLERKTSKVIQATPDKKSKKVSEASPSKRASASPKKGKKVAGEENSFTKFKGKSPKAKNSPKQTKKKENKEEVKEATKQQNKNLGKRKREVTEEVDSALSKRSKIEKKTEVEMESTVKSTNTKKGKNELTLSKSQRNLVQRKKETVRKKTVKKLTESENKVNETVESEKNFELDDIVIPEIASVSGNLQLSRSQLRLVSMETPPLKYFNSNLKSIRSATPVTSPDWFTSQRTESEVKRFQKRREEAFKKRMNMNIQKTTVTEKTRKVQNGDVKRIMEWVAEKAVKSPVWNSKVLQYVIPSRKRMEEEANTDEDEDFDRDFI